MSLCASRAGYRLHVGVLDGSEVKAPSRPGIGREADR